MPRRPRTMLRAVSRDAQRRLARAGRPVGPKDVSAIVHGPHDRAFLYSGTVNGGGQARINHKRNQRAKFWADFLELRDSIEALLRRGVMTLNEARGELGLAPHRSDFGSLGVAR